MAVEFKEATQLQAHYIDGLVKPIALIESWAVVDGVISQHFATLRPGKRLRGHVLGLAHISVAKLVHSSPIVRVDLAHGLVETRNTIYRLGEVSEDYDSWRAATHWSESAAGF